ncbi:hypothetical protein AMAG_10608 [Allomyces macrogynus ATCC 38327]|uniref:20S-pre-rRNA D-site endonuclease NOB1 n=1 Tax=Allomyces macrogynus (strain ATCC 38327) TaxID=578462 RepID=A0A0L0SQX2_ALLM3|nr:hypothetical protein AMAG_10608 [Allomyces macrogynus ATCC 38327]|eukprot:KNE64943.1 hypothetical protein AMAG_10608 [Allomyces macrogynus ATCC 38327]
MTSKMPAPALSAATLLPNGFYALTLPPLMRKGKGKVYLAGHDEPLFANPHQLFFRPHDARVPSDLLPADRTVFVYNLPLDTTPAQLKTLFQPAGKVEAVIIGNVGPTTTKEDVDARMATLTDPTTAAPHRPAEVAYVIYKKATALPQLPKIVHAKNWAVKASMPMGLARYKVRFDATHATDHAALEERAKEAVPSVSCMSDDFALQNVLLQMNLNLLSLDGMVIKQLKNWLMRCHACFKTTMDMDKRFCPSCGGATLIRTSYSIEDGVMKLHLKRVFQYRTRGTVYSLPKPKGGREGDQLILREDQKEYQVQRKNFEHHKKKQERKGWDEIMLNAAAASAVARPPTIGFGSKNPNEAKRARK